MMHQIRSLLAQAALGLSSLFATAPEAGEMICAPPPFAAPAAGSVLGRLAPVFAAFPSFGETLNTHVANLCVQDRIVDARGYFEPETRRIVVDGSLSPGMTQAVMVHELRHVSQEAEGTCLSLDLSRKAYARGVLALEADASVTSLHVAWTLREAGQPGMWDALAGWRLQGDLTDTYLRTRNKGAGPVAAASASFAQWFEMTERREAYHLNACFDYLDQIDRDHLLPGTDDLPADYLATLCRLPDGTPYPCAFP